jgi:DnaJ family protein A protein 2
MGGPGRSRSGPVDTKLYEILQVEPTASDDEIKKSYRKLAKEFHPDKNKDHGDKFKEISFAYEILSNPDKRRQYDAVGLDGLKDGGGGGGMDDIFSHMFGGDEDGGFSPFGGLFGGMGGGGRRAARRKHQDTVYPLHITLEEAYVGKTSKLKITQKGLCKACSGTGSKSGKITTCTACKGRGMTMKVRQLGPGMLQQMQVPCTDCSGSGDKIVESDRCPGCKGAKNSDVTKVHEIPVQPGVQHGEKIKLAGEGNHADPTAEPGDIIVVVQIKDHAVFTREGDDLLMKHELSLNEALCGFEIAITHLDGRRIVLSNKPGEVVVPGTQLGIVGEGMPVNRHSDLKGNLLVKFEVNFPKDHFFDDENNYKVLRTYLPSAKAVAATAGAEEVSLMDFDENKYGKGRGQAYDEADEDEDMEEGHAHGQRVQCAQS